MTLNVTKPGWLQAAACRGLPTAWWYPDRSEARLHTYEVAKTLCAGCCVRHQCLDEAIAEEAARDLNYVYGLRGGLTARQRKVLIRERVASAVDPQLLKPTARPMMPVTIPMSPNHQPEREPFG
jgi:hypothetical protein